MNFAIRCDVGHHENIRFDVARGLSALVVFVAHATQVFLWPFFEPGSWLEILAGASARGAVLIFFLLSGLLITKSIVSNVKRNGHFEPVDYLLNRIARLYPPLIFALAVTVAVVLIVHYFGLPGSNGALGKLRSQGLAFGRNEFWHALLLYDGMTGVNGPLWTLYIEVKLYITAMGAAMVICGRSPTMRIAGAALMGAAFYLSLPLYGFWFFATIWIFGAVLNIKSKLVIAGSGLSVIAISAALAPLSGGYLDGSSLSLGLQAGGCVAFAYCLLLSRWAEINYPIGLRATADYSYTLYVTHFPLLALGLSVFISSGYYSVVSAATFMAVTGMLSLTLIWAVAKPLEAVPFYKRRLGRLLAFRSDAAL